MEEHQKKEKAVIDLMNVIGNRKVVVFGCEKWGKLLYGWLLKSVLEENNVL